MPFNDNQLFYAALYMTEALPGGNAFTDEICQKYGMPYSPTNAPQAEYDEGRFQPLSIADTTADNVFDVQMPAEEMKRVAILLETGVTQRQCKDFFKELLKGLKEYKRKRPLKSLSGGEYIEMRVTDDDELLQHRCLPLATALKKAGIPSQALNRKVAAYAHDNGLLFCGDGKNQQNIDYVGQPALEGRYLPDFQSSDMAHCPKVRRETFWRLVDFSAGQEIFIVTDEHKTKKVLRRAGKIGVAQGDATVPLEDLTDEDVLTGSDKITYSENYYRTDFEPGGMHYKPERGEVLEETATPGLFRHLSGPMACMEVKDIIHFGAGSSFTTARPGDKIIDEGGPRLIRDFNGEAAKACFIPVNNPSAVQSIKRKIQ